MTISQSLLEQKLLECLADNVADEARLDDIVHPFETELKKKLADEAELVQDLASRKVELNHEKAELLKQKQNVVNFIKQVGPNDDDLNKEYTGLVNRIAAIEKQLAACDSVPMRQFSEGEIREFLAEQTQHFAELLAGDPIRTREELRKRVKELVMTPVITNNARFYHISGDVRLFGRTEDVMQDKQGELSALHYTLPLELEIEVRPRRKSQPVLANLNGGETPSLNDDLCASGQEDAVSKGLNDLSGEKGPCGPTTEEIGEAFCVAKHPTAVLMPPATPDAAVGNGR